MFHPGIRTSSHPRLPSDPSLMVLLNRTFSNKTSKKKKHISQVQGGQTLTHVLYIGTGYRYESINLRGLSFHVRSAYVYALVLAHVTFFIHNLWVTRGIRPILIELDIYFLLLKAQSLPKKKQESGKFLSVSNRAEMNFSTWDISTYLSFSYSPLLSEAGWFFLLLVKNRLIMARWADSL